MGGERFSWPVNDRGKAGMLAAFLELGVAELEEVYEWMCWKDKAVKRGEIIMITGRRMCQWDQTSVSLKYAVF